MSFAAGYIAGAPPGQRRRPAPAGGGPGRLTLSLPCRRPVRGGLASSVSAASPACAGCCWGWVAEVGSLCSDNMVSKLNASKGATVGSVISDMGWYALFTRGLPLRIAMVGTLTGLQWGAPLPLHACCWRSCLAAGLIAQLCRRHLRRLQGVRRPAHHGRSTAPGEEVGTRRSQCSRHTPCGAPDRALGNCCRRDRVVLAPKTPHAQPAAQSTRSRCKPSLELSPPVGL